MYSLAALVVSPVSLSLANKNMYIKNISTHLSTMYHMHVQTHKHTHTHTQSYPSLFILQLINTLMELITALVLLY